MSSRGHRSGPGRVVVIGGGIAGLTTAALLARGGAQVTLLERHDQLGGRAGTLSIDGFRFDTGPSWYFMPEVFAHAFALLGERIEDHVELERLDPAYRLFPEGSDPFDVVADPEANWATFDAREPGAGDAMRRYAERATQAYRTALDSFLYTTFARPDRLLSAEILRQSGTLAGLLTGTLAGKVAATVTDPVLRQVLGYHAVFLGSSPYRVPALYSLMSHLDLVDGVRFPRGGMYTVIEALERIARTEGVEVRTGADVSLIEIDDEGPSVRHPRRSGTARGVRLADGSLVPADVVVSAADRHHTETALLGRHRDLPEEWWEDRGPGISALLIMAGVRGELPELAHHSLFFTRDWPTNFEDILGVAGPVAREEQRVVRQLGELPAHPGHDQQRGDPGTPVLPPRAGQLAVPPQQRGLRVVTVGRGHDHVGADEAPVGQPHSAGLS